MKYPTNAELTTAAAPTQIFLMNPILTKYYFQFRNILAATKKSNFLAALTNRMII